MYACPALTSWAPAWNANHSSPSLRSASTISVVLPTPGSPTSSTDRGRARRERTDECVDGRDPAADERRRRPFAGIDDATELTEEVDVDDRRSATSRARGLRAAFVAAFVPSISSPTSGCRRVSRASRSAAVTSSPAATRASRKRETCARERALAPVLFGSREHGRDDLPVALRRARGGAVGARPIPHASKRVSAVSVHSGGAGRPAAIAAIAPARRNLLAPRSATSANASSSMLSRSASNSTSLENSSSWSSWSSVDPGVGIREPLPERDHLPDGGLLLLPSSHVR